MNSKDQSLILQAIDRLNWFGHMAKNSNVIFLERQ